MRRIFYLLFLPLFFLTSCEDFDTWREYNESWIEAKEATLGEDSELEVIETVVLPSGVLIEKYHNGYGAIPKPSEDPTTGLSSYVCVTYSGWLIDGTLFDSGEESTLALSAVIDGWQYALSTMKQGSHWRIYIPYDVGYGEDGYQPDYGNFTIPPYSTLIFDIDLVDVLNY